MPSLTFTRTDGMTAVFPIIWTDHLAQRDGERALVPVPSLSPEHDEALSDFVGYDVMPTIAYLWVDGNGIASADVDGGHYVLTF